MLFFLTNISYITKRHDVARRTEIVYDSVSATETKSLQRKVRNLWECGRLAGPLMATLFLFCHYWILFLDYVQTLKISR